MSTLRIVRLLGWMFVVTTGFGVLAVLAPTLEFKSPMEMLLPDQLASTNFVRTLVHPSLSSSSDFLGYVQPRPTAPFPYSNAWGNNLALYLPFFILGWFGRDAGWRARSARSCWSPPSSPSPSRSTAGCGSRWRSRRSTPPSASPSTVVDRALQALVAAVLVGGMVFVSSPLYDTLAPAGGDPHSNDRRAGTAKTVVSVTAAGSPLSGTAPPGRCRAASTPGRGRDRGVPPVRCPPLGTQGFMWRLVLTTGFGGTLLCLSFFALQFLRRARGAAPLDVTTCTVLLVAVLCFFVYDSLGSAMFTALIAVGLMARADEADSEETA